MPIFAAVDIGSNSVRLSIARLLRGRLQVLHQDREVTRLGKGVFTGGILDPQAIAHTIKVLKRFHRSVQDYSADQVRVVATSALRDAKNSRAFIEWVRSATGWRPEVISGLEEGRLIHLGVISKTRLSVPRMLLIDLGGGSCELTISVRKHIQQIVSLPLGAVRLTQEFLKHDPPKKSELQRLRDYIAEEVERVAGPIAKARVTLTIATSGTAAALAAANQAIGTSRSSRTVVSRTSTVKLAAKLAKLSMEERENVAGIGPRRAEIIVAGAMVYAEVLQLCGLRGFRYSPLGLRDGVLAQLAADYDQDTRSHRQVESERWDALLATGKKYGAELKYAKTLRELVLKLFTALRSIHGLPSDYREWLSAAAMLHEVGTYVNLAGRYRHAYYIIANTEIFGYSAKQRQIIAAIIRYQGNSRPSTRDSIFKQASVVEWEDLEKAVILMRMARALNQSRRGTVKSVTARVNAGSVTLHLSAARGAELEMWALEKEFAYFRDVFGRNLGVELS
jgi:exopolyphosphatase/guanosine-5'-triphosphate,3'-diphosphate pyrophosphatase